MAPRPVDPWRTLGVEEEFFLVDAETGNAVAGAPEMARLLADEPAVTPEFMRYQIETATPVCAGLGQVRAELDRLRRLLVGAADRVGCLLVATGVLPFDTPPTLSAVTDLPRYRDLVDRFPGLLSSASTCGCHVHVGVPSREVGVQVLSRIRSWLPQLLAVGANSPFAMGRDTGWDSWRHPMWSRWPTARPPEIWADAGHYDAAVRHLVDSGAAVDPRGVYWHARLSPRYPTVEVRIADVGLSVDDAVLLAGLVRALVATAVEELRAGRPAPAVPTARIAAALSAAARHGLGGPGIDVFSGDVTAQRQLFQDLLDHLRPGLEVTGDADEVERLAGGVVLGGSGADRQREMRAASATTGEFVMALAAATAASRAPELTVDGNDR
ncbi:carboxylate-amine ligase [Kutzneria kofuensis]|uniref:Putative glutamate--cysteine ligase 2 n=1 Tax=Kutzneria kofuensis TaxID=103725 RepID=A0A7W9KQK8_9PSEU|nr:glutamate--cysteine ligase [Kutzneria kofuensis]MBB5896613.1 carboxylate-amine ligase [Kutzneria kofuensis]